MSTSRFISYTLSRTDTWIAARKPEMQGNFNPLGNETGKAKHFHLGNGIRYAWTFNDDNSFRIAVFFGFLQRQRCTTNCGTGRASAHYLRIPSFLWWFVARTALPFVPVQLCDFETAWIACGVLNLAYAAPRIASGLRPYNIMKLQDCV